MTSKTSLPSFGRLLVADFKRNLWLTGISSLGVLSGVLLYFYYKVISFQAIYHVEFFSHSTRYLEERRNVIDSFFCHNDSLVLILFLLAVINGIYLVSRYYDRKRMDFYFSQPVKRRNWFLICLVEGMLNVAVPYLAFVFGMIPIFKNLNFLDGNILKEWMVSYLSYISFYVSVFSLALLAASISGHQIYACLNIMFLLFYAPILSIVGRIGVTFFAFIAGTIAFQRRGADDPKTLIVQPRLKKVVKALLLVHGTLVFTLIPMFCLGNLTLLASTISFLIGLIICMYVIESVMENDWKVFFCSLHKQVPYAVLCIAAFIVFYTVTKVMFVH